MTFGPKHKCLQFCMYVQILKKIYVSYTPFWRFLKFANSSDQWWSENRQFHIPNQERATARKWENRNGSKIPQFADVSPVFWCSLMKLIWRRGEKSEILLLSNSLTFARSPIVAIALFLSFCQHRTLTKSGVGYPSRNRRLRTSLIWKLWMTKATACQAH